MSPSPIERAPSPALSVIMPCHNRGYDLMQTLRRYEQQDIEEPFELIAVDDGSTDNTYQVLSSYQPERFVLRAERLSENRGPAAARNHAIALANAPLLLFVGDDILPEPWLLRGHLTAHRRYRAENIAILGRVVWSPHMPVNTLMKHIDGIGAQQFSYHYFQDGKEYDFRHFYTANISMKRNFLLEEPKWFDTDFRFAAFEDAELAYRLSRRGLRIVYASILVAYHTHYHNIWTFSRRQYLAGRMAYLFAKKHPAVRRLVIGRGWSYRILYWRLLGSLGTYPRQRADWLEAEWLHLLSAFEWQPHPLLDQLYLSVLGYFYFKGIIEEICKSKPLAESVQNVYASRLLAPLLVRFYRESKRLNAPLPDHHGAWVLNRLAGWGVKEAAWEQRPA